MPFRPTTTTTTAASAAAAIFSLYTTITHHFFSTTTTTRKLPRLRTLSKIPSRYRPQAIQEAQKALTDYLHSTRSLPFTYAENIGQNAVVSLSVVISQVHFQPSTFFNSLQRFLRYHPINEFEFFYESIGIDYKEINALLPVKKFFLSEDFRVFNAACALADFGFPWNKLGMLYKQKVEIFSKEPMDLRRMFRGFKDSFGFNNVMVVGICLTFPQVLGGNGGELSDEVDELLSDLRRVFVDSDLVSVVEGNVDAWCEICRKIRLFYDLSCGKGKFGELLEKSKHIFVDYLESELVQKIEFFCRLAVNKEEVGLLLLSKPEIFSFDLENRVISVVSFLKQFNLRAKKLRYIEHNYPYVLGRNKMVNVPHIIRSVHLTEWFFDRIRYGHHHLLGTYVDSSQDEDTDEDYTTNLQKIQCVRTHIHSSSKLDFLHSIGFGENKFTVKVFVQLHGSSCELQERFNCLLCGGIEFSKLCRMLYLSPKILNQNAEILERKLKFLCEGMGSSVQYLDAFPAYLCYDLEKRIKPRYKFYMWLTEQGWCTKEYSVASMIATSEKNFIARISDMHPDAPKKWYESIANENQDKSCQEIQSCSYLPDQ